MKQLLIVLIAMCGAILYGQTFSDLTTSKGKKLHDAYTLQIFFDHLNNSDPYTSSVSYTTINGSLRIGSSGKGELSWNYENPTLGDLLYMATHLKKFNSFPDKAFGSGFFGWHQFYFNAVVRERLIIAPGFSLGDYIFALQQPNLPSEIRYPEPNGYYLHLGPALKTSYILTNRMWIEGYLHADFSYLKVGKPTAYHQKIDGYEKPIFLNFGAKVFHTSRFFGGFRMCKLMDRGVNHIKSTRLDISAGYMF